VPSWIGAPAPRLSRLSRFSHGQVLISTITGCVALLSRVLTGPPTGHHAADRDRRITLSERAGEATMTTGVGSAG
jgi:hypothetical protein